MPKIKFKSRAGYVVGLLTLPTDVGAVQVATLGGTKADALMRAATIAQRISEDPVMAALMPPQAQAAIAAAKALSAAARKGPRALKGLWGKIKGPGKRRLAEALAKEQAAKTTVGALYWGQESKVKQPNRGSWEGWLDPYHEDPEDGYAYDDDDDDDDEYIELGRRKRRKKRSKRGSRARRKRAAEPEAPTDEVEPEAPTDEAEAYDDDEDGAEA